MEIQGGVFIIAGSATGLGAEVARQLAAKGGRVVINYTRSEAEAKGSAEACRAADGEAILCQADVSVDEDCRRMAAAAMDQWGRIDGLVNNAATSVIVPHHNLEGLASEDFRRVLDVNVVGAFQMARAVTPAMQEQSKGAIVNVERSWMNSKWRVHNHGFSDRVGKAARMVGTLVTRVACQGSRDNGPPGRRDRVPLS